MISQVPQYDSGASETFGFIVLITISIGIASSIVVLGSGPIDDFVSDADQAKSQNSFSKFGSSANQTALSGEYSSTSVNLGLQKSGDDSLEVNNDSSIKIEIEDETGTRNEIVNEKIGNVQYENGDSTITYENGGVWKGTGKYAEVISPPEFDYNNRTLTLPLITSDQKNTLTGDSVYISQQSRSFDSEQIVVDNDTVVVTIQSPIYRGWGKYFERNIEGNTETKYYDNSNTVEIKLGLEAPTKDTYETAITGMGGVHVDGKITGPVRSTGEIDGKSNIDGEVKENIDTEFEHINNTISEEISDAEKNGTEMNSASGTISSGKYYADNNLDLGNATFDVSGGDIVIGVPGDISISGDSDVVGSNGEVKIYSEGDTLFDTGSGSNEVNLGGDPEDFQIYGTNTMNVRIVNNVEYTGVIYAPRKNQDEAGPQDVNISTNDDGKGKGKGKSKGKGKNGNKNFKGNNCKHTTADTCLANNSTFRGSLLAGSADIRRGSEVHYDEDLLDEKIEVIDKTEERPEIVYLHVSINELKYE
jgi:hypothetical protein